LINTIGNPDDLSIGLRRTSGASKLMPARTSGDATRPVIGEIAHRTSPIGGFEAARSVDLISDETSTRELRATMAATGHDLMQPLQIVSHCVERFGASRQNDSDRVWIEAARTQIARLARGLTNLVQVAVAQGAAPTPAQQCLGPILDDTQAAWAQPAAASGIVFNIDRLAVPVRTDRPRLRSILDNLISNAFKYGSGHVNLSASILPLGVRIDVLNDGGPIPPHVQERSFDAFYQADPSSSGLGIGLSIVREHCRSLGYQIEVVSDPFHTRFSILIPDEV